MTWTQNLLRKWTNSLSSHQQAKWAKCSCSNPPTVHGTLTSPAIVRAPSTRGRRALAFHSTCSLASSAITWEWIKIVHETCKPFRWMLKLMETLGKRPVNCSTTSASAICLGCPNCARPSMRTRTKTQFTTRISRRQCPTLATRRMWRRDSWRIWRTWSRSYPNKLWPLVHIMAVRKRLHRRRKGSPIVVKSLI